MCRCHQACNVLELSRDRGGQAIPNGVSLQRLFEQHILLPHHFTSILHSGALVDIPSSRIYASES